MKSQRANDDDVDLLRIATWNINGLRGDHDLIAQTLTALNPDIVCLQEVPLNRSGVQRVEEIAEAAGLRLVAGDHQSAGLAILAGDNVNPDDVRVAPLVKMRRRWRPLPQYPRAILSVYFPFDEDIIFVENIHLSLNEDERVAHASRVVDLADAVRRPTIVAGDFNEPPSGPAWSAMATLLDDAGVSVPNAVTFPASNPESRIDSIHMSPGLELLDYLVVRGVDGQSLSEASDHLPVVADIATRRRTRGTAAAVLAEAESVVETAINVTGGYTIRARHRKPQ